MRRCAAFVMVLGCGSVGDDGASGAMTDAATATASATVGAESGSGPVTSPSGPDGTTSGSGASTGDPSSPTSDGDATESDSSGEPLPPPPTCGALEQVPSEPGPHIAQIEGLAANEWLALGAPAGDPQYGVARGRSWGGRAFAPAPALRGAFFTGEGVHAYVKPDGFAMDDHWFYDINAHAWIAVHPGNELATFNQRVADGDLSIDENGQLQDEHGDPVPLHILIHAWDFLTYNTTSHQFALLAGGGMGEYYMPGWDQISEGMNALYAQREGIEVPPMSPWFYSTADCRWERYPISTPTPSVGSYAAFVYVETDDQYVYAGSQGVAVFDPTAGEWSMVEDTGPRPTGYDHGVAYDSNRKVLYMGSGDGGSGPLHVYDIDAATWTTPAGAPTMFRTNSASIFYDTANDVVTLFHYGDGIHYTYEPDANSWTNQPMPAELSDRSQSAFYDPVINAYFVFDASDSRDDGTMWAYRHAP